jgi:hypothetical protein
MSAMPEKDTSRDEESGRILRFRHRRSDELAPPDLSKYERGREPEDYRHRMLMNIAGLAVLGLLIGIGLWLATSIADLRKNQDCALSGRRNCTPIEVNR